MTEIEIKNENSDLRYINFEVVDKDGKHALLQ